MDINMPDPDEKPSMELIAYKLGELSTVTKQGFDKLDGRLTKHEERLNNLERWQAVEKATTKQPKAGGISSWKPVLIAIGIVIAAAVTYITSIAGR